MPSKSLSTAGRPAALVFAISVAAIECLGLIVYGVWIAASAALEGSSGAQGSNVSPVVLLIVFLMFGALIGLVVRALWRGKGSARTAYLLTQGFALVIAQTLVNGGEPGERYLGWALIAAAVGGAVSILTPSASVGLNLTR